MAQHEDTTEPHGIVSRGIDLHDTELSRAALADDERGAVYVEYLVIASLVTITGAAAVVTLGVPLYNLFRYVEVMILLPVP